MNLWMFFGLFPILLVYSIRWGETRGVSRGIDQSQSLSDSESLVSEGGDFEPGFFSPGSSTDRYLGIWYKSIPIRTVVWVANRKTTIKGLTGILMINSTGSILVSTRTNGDIRQIPNGGQDFYIWIEASKQAKRRVVEAVISSLTTVGCAFSVRSRLLLSFSEEEEG